MTFDGKGEHGDVKRDRVPAKGRLPGTRGGTSLTESICMYQKDRELLLAVMDYYGCSKAEAFRTILRSHAIQIGLK